MLKIWLREPHHTDDEAVKLIVDETSDVSDVLLRVPELLRVQYLKPSELQVEYKDVVLSNRRPVSGVLGGEKEGTFVIRPRPGVVVPNMKKKLPSYENYGKEKSSTTSLPFSRKHQPFLPKRSATTTSPRVTSESFRTPISFEKNSGKPPVAKVFSQVSISARSNEMCASKNRRTSFGRTLSDRSAQSCVKTPRRDLSIAGSDDRLLVSLRRADLKHVASRFRQNAEKVRAPSKRAQVLAVCDSFKPQWGKPLCATCNHSKQSHWISQKNKEKTTNSGFHLETNGIICDNEPIITRNSVEN